MILSFLIPISRPNNPVNPQAQIGNWIFSGSTRAAVACEHSWRSQAGSTAIQQVGNLRYDVGSNSHYECGARLCPEDQPQCGRKNCNARVSRKAFGGSTRCGWCSAHTAALQERTGEPL